MEISVTIGVALDQFEYVHRKLSMSSCMLEVSSSLVGCGVFLEENPSSWKTPFGVSMNKSKTNQMILYHISTTKITIKTLLTRTGYYIFLRSSFKCFIKKNINSMNIFVGGSSEIHPTFISKIHWIYILHDMNNKLKPINAWVQAISAKLNLSNFWINRISNLHTNSTPKIDSINSITQLTSY